MQGKRRGLDELELVAREATREALVSYKDVLAPYLSSEQLTLGSGYEGEIAVFELYVCGVRPQDALVLSQTKVCRSTGEVQSVEIFAPPKRADELSND